MTPNIDEPPNPVARWLGLPTSACVLVAEVGQAHDGSLGTAHAFVDAAADAGADAIKFQTHIAAAESTPTEPWRVKFSYQDATRYDYWRRMEFTADQWSGLRDHAVERGLGFLSTPFSLEAIDLLGRIGMPAWKVASGEVTNLRLLREMAARGPVLLSSGMSTWAELDAAVRAVEAAGSEVAVMQCTSAYPTGPEDVGLNLLEEYRARYGCPVGLSDHSGTVFPSLAAATMGADVIELHFTLSRRMFGPDVRASVTVEELAVIRSGVDFIAGMRSHPVDKDRAAKSMQDMRTLFTRSLVAARALPSGHVLQPTDLVEKKPGTGINPQEIGRVVGRSLLHDVERDDVLSFEDLGEPL